MHLAMAWVDASEEVGEPSLRGTSQHFNEFWSKVRANYLKHQPAPCPPGKYSHRATTALQTQWRDNIAREARRFNRNLLLVLNSRPTGCTEQQKINMAVAIQLGKTDVRSYRHRDFEARDWKFYQAWEALKGHRAFLQPTEPTEEEEEDDSVVQQSTSGESNTTTNANSNAAVAPTPTQASRDRSRGPGPGAKKTRALAKEEEYKKKKAKLQEGMYELTKERTAAYKQHVDNLARMNAFNMALSAFNACKDWDPAAAAKYKDTMDNIMQHNTVADDEEDDMIVSGVENMSPLRASED